jgi:hypothetical protein
MTPAPIARAHLVPRNPEQSAWGFGAKGPRLDLCSDPSGTSLRLFRRRPAGGTAAPPATITYATGCACAHFVPLVDIYGTTRCGLCDRTGDAAEGRREGGGRR